jgi:hypothetical protein
VRGEPSEVGRRSGEWEGKLVGGCQERRVEAIWKMARRGAGGKATERWPGEWKEKAGGITREI